MNSLESQLKRCSRNWKTFFGAPVITLCLFLSIASTTAIIDRPNKEKAPPLTFVYVPPPPPPPSVQTTPPLSSSLAESFKFDPTTAVPLPDIPLEFLEIRLDPIVDTGVAVPLEFDRTFQVQNPLEMSPFIIFERSQVDEIPVWLYGPMPKLTSGFDRENVDMVVLYTVTDKGRTENVHVLDASKPEMAPALKDAIERWRFRPARKGGTPVRVWVQQTVNYRPSSTSPFSL